MPPLNCPSLPHPQPNFPSPPRLHSVERAPNAFCGSGLCYTSVRQSAARRIDMKTQTVIIALTAPAFADHNRTDEQGRKRGHWTEFPESRGI